ncbi:Short-chain dehydrogenase/reductase 2b [Rhizophlyctis rosea]|uniref:Short-chain dehydrogenase/reductase 2b n=1 Tax=Rhizophlyctis rosea TaxID=64517 RepID=A0AAD5X0K3_9FUNG|nr:Short-chain dehydrogenase/reductase 2b [Rhizophlyctis rosea]
MVTANLTRRLAVITGGNSGLGFHTAAKILQQGNWDVVIACRNPSTAAKAAETLRSNSPLTSTVTTLPLDISSASSISAFIPLVPRPINLLLLNAGVHPTSLRHTEDGLEEAFGVNHIGHFRLTLGLIENEKIDINDGRVVSIASGMHTKAKFDFDDLKGEKGFNAGKAYSNSKLANMWFIVELAEYFKEKGWNVTANSLCPGYVPTTGLSRDYPRILQKLAPYVMTLIIKETPLPDSIRHIEWVSTSPDLDDISGRWFDVAVGQKVTEKPLGSDESRDQTKARRLWNVSCDITGLERFKR